MYAWSDVAERTEKVYDAVIEVPHRDTYERLSRCVFLSQKNFEGSNWECKEGRRLTCRLLTMGVFFGPILCCIMAVQHWFLLFIEMWRPLNEIEMVESDWSLDRFSKVSLLG